MIAVVDDDTAVRDAVADLLEVIRLDARTFASAKVFLEAYRPGQYRCVITDMRMKPMSGIDLASRLRTLEPDLPVILLTAQPEVARDLTRDNGQCILAKPVDAADLVSHVLKALGRNG